MSIMSGARFIAETLKGYGVTHVFWVETFLRQALVEMEALGIRRILTHSEKAAAYMADGYARVTHKPGVCMAQSVGAANLAAGLQDAYLGHSPVISITGRRPPLEEHRNAYQEILHDQLFDPVTKFHANAVSVEQLPFLLRQAFREATTGTPGPVHLDFPGLEGEFETQETELEVIVEKTFSKMKTCLVALLAALGAGCVTTDGNTPDTPNQPLPPPGTTLIKPIEGHPRYRAVIDYTHTGETRHYTAYSLRDW